MRVGIERRTAAQVLSHAEESKVAVQALPPRPSGSLVRAGVDLGIPAAKNGERVFHLIGDSGGIGDPNPQKAVVAAMVADLQAHPDVAFAWHVGDIIYYEGLQKEAVPQLFEPYAEYLRTLLGNPGNHDGEGGDQLASFMRYFCSPTAQLLPEVEEYHRDTVTQPYCYWTLADEVMTVIALYTNVPSGGSVEAEQVAWLEQELAAAPKGKPLIVSLHHPPLSADGHHGGSLKMLNMLDAASAKVGRWPDLIVSGHVHNFQRFTRKVAGGREVPYIVCGASGYHNRHAMASGAVVGQQIVPGVTLEAFNAGAWGFLRLAVTANAIKGEYVAVKPGQPSAVTDSFTLPVGV
jgi:hypothetical protein